MAEHFAGKLGCVWETAVKTAEGQGAIHLARQQLLMCLKGFGKGKAKWNDAFEVAQAARYVEEWSEHLLDWSNLSPSSITEAVGRSFRKSHR